MIQFQHWRNTTGQWTYYCFGIFKYIIYPLHTSLQSDPRRSVCNARLRHCSHGELGTGHIPGGKFAVWRRGVVSVEQANDHRAHRTRAGAPGSCVLEIEIVRWMNGKWPAFIESLSKSVRPLKVLRTNLNFESWTFSLFFLSTVVWKFGDHEMVEPNMAERRLCHIHVLPRRGPSRAFV